MLSPLTAMLKLFRERTAVSQLAITWYVTQHDLTLVKDAELTDHFRVFIL